MLSSLLAAGGFVSPHVDYHALAPEIVLGAGSAWCCWSTSSSTTANGGSLATLSGFVLLGALLPVVTLSVIGPDVRSMFDGRYVVDNFSLVLKGLFLLTGYIVVLLSTNEIEEGGYHQGEYYVMLLSSILGMVMMSSSRDLISVFVALELLSIPAYMMAAWRKRDPQEQRGRRQVLPARRVRQRRDAVRHEPAVRRHRQHQAHRDRRGRDRQGQARRRRGDGRRVRHRRLRLQGQRRAVPHLGARHVRGRTDAGHRVPQRGVEGCRVRGPGADGLPRRSRMPPTCIARSSGCSPR